VSPSCEGDQETAFNFVKNGDSGFSRPVASRGVDRIRIFLRFFAFFPLASLHPSIWAVETFNPKALLTRYRQRGAFLKGCLNFFAKRGWTMAAYHPAAPECVFLSQGLHYRNTRFTQASVLHKGMTAR
jgi:hypothetical protein